MIFTSSPIIFLVILIIASTFGVFPDSLVHQNSYGQSSQNKPGSSLLFSSHHQTSTSSGKSPSIGTSKSLKDSNEFYQYQAKVEKLPPVNTKYRRLSSKAFKDAKETYPSLEYKLGKPIKSAVVKSNELDVYYITRGITYNGQNHKRQRGEFMVKGWQSRSAADRGKSPEVVTYAVMPKKN